MHKDRVLVTLAGLVGMMGVRAAEADCVRLPNTGLQASFRAPWTLSDEYKPWVLPGGDEYDDEEGIEGAIGAFVGDADVITGELSWVYVRVTTGDASTCTALRGHPDAEVVKSPYFRGGTWSLVVNDGGEHRYDMDVVGRTIGCRAEGGRVLWVTVVDRVTAMLTEPDGPARIAATAAITASASRSLHDLASGTDTACPGETAIEPSRAVARAEPPVVSAPPVATAPPVVAVGEASPEVVGDMSTATSDGYTTTSGPEAPAPDGDGDGAPKRPMVLAVAASLDFVGEPELFGDSRRFYGARARARSLKKLALGLDVAAAAGDDQGVRYDAHALIGTGYDGYRFSIGLLTGVGVDGHTDGIDLAWKLPIELSMRYSFSEQTHYQAWWRHEWTNRSSMPMAPTSESTLGVELLRARQGATLVERGGWGWSVGLARHSLLGTQVYGVTLGLGQIVVTP